MRITRLEAKGIGPFEDLNIEFKPKPAGMENKAEIHILTGENGTGKSTILLMLASCWDNSNDELISERFHVEPWSFYRALSEIKSKFFVEFDEMEQFHSYSSAISNHGTIFFSDLKKNEIRLKETLEMRNNPFFAYSGYRQIRTLNNVSIAEPSINPFDKSIEFDKKLDFDLIIDWIVMNKMKMLVAQNRDDSNASARYGRTVSKVEETISEIIKKRIKFEVFDEPAFKLRIRVNEKSLDFNILPDGLKSIISWLSDLLMRLDRINWADKTKSILEQNFILFLDEIEVHLHPSWQRKILLVVQDLFPNAQIFISTHSPFVVGSVDGARVYKFKLDENNNSVLEKEYLTEDGHSYQYYLRTGFDIESDFGLKNELDLKQFMLLKEKIIKGEEVNMDEFDEIVNRLENQTGELSSIVGFEKRKLEKYLATN